MRKTIENKNCTKSDSRKTDFQGNYRNNTLRAVSFDFVADNKMILQRTNKKNHNKHCTKSDSRKIDFQGNYRKNKLRAESRDFEADSKMIL